MDLYSTKSLLAAFLAAYNFLRMQEEEKASCLVAGPGSFPYGMLLVSKILLRILDLISL